MSDFFFISVYFFVLLQCYCLFARNICLADSSPEFASKVKDLCQLLGITDHPDPVVCLKVRRI